ncbi:maleylpyruvate isomerase family mycothiol-dependent enzyme [Gordonia soli]|uniref:Mycothiol-dependent maleylpyruvate isomerase metal-binding domain-containing protein n=1 Tax=Gordonia soli NBRC 108243 TaxID=1223545 RepID=M0QJC6_9ACTN|nr:hypothetical protein GS4_17_00540 [Gordonia soli NBRC 108243]
MFSRFDFIDAARAAADQFVTLVDAVDDPDLALSATPGWTITDCLGHVASTPSRYHELIDGRGTYAATALDLPDFNAKQIANLTTRDRRTLCTRLLTDLDELLDTVAHLGACVPKFTFDGGSHVRADVALGMLIGEFLVHGHDIAREVGARWDIDPQYAALVVRGRNNVLLGWSDADACVGYTATYDIRLRGVDERFVYEFTDGELEIDPADPRPADVHLSLDPVAALLAGYGRVSAARTALSGRAIAWGTRPWLALTLPRRFRPA